MTREEQTRFQYAGAIGLLCELSLNITDQDEKDMLDNAISDFCNLNEGWTWQRVLDRVEVFPPELPEAPKS